MILVDNKYLSKIVWGILHDGKPLTVLTSDKTLIKELFRVKKQVHKDNEIRIQTYNLHVGEVTKKVNSRRLVNVRKKQ